MAKAKKSVPADDVYVLKVVGQNGEAHRGFVWPLTVGATVTAPDWQPHRECGNGLHGWLWGEGDVSASGDRHADPASKWLVLRVAKASIVELDRKVKFPSCVVEFVGLREAAVSRMAELAGAGRQIVYGTSTSGHHGTSTSGDGGTSTSGHHGTSTSGECGILVIRWWDEEAEPARYRLAVGYVGEGGIRPNAKYKVVGRGVITEVV
jgi:hypothetical protein